MIYCTKCGAELTDDATFCTKCGTKVAINSAKTNENNDAANRQESVPAPAAQPAKEKKQINVGGMIKRNFLPLYVILGAVSYVLMEFCAESALVVFGLSITFAVLAILCALAFCIVGIVKFATADKTLTDNKHTSADIICLALGIIMFVYVLVSSIIVLSSAADYWEGMDALNSLPF